MCGCVVVIEVGVDGRLVLITLLEVGDHAMLIEEALEEYVVARDAADLELRSRLHPHITRGRRQAVGRNRHAVGVKPLAVGQDRLARGAKRFERQAELIGGGRWHAALRQAHQQSAHPIVMLGAPQRALYAEHRDAAASQDGKRTVGLLVGERTAKIEHHDRPLGHRGRARHRRQPCEKHDRRADREQGQPGEHTGECQ